MNLPRQTTSRQSRPCLATTCLACLVEFSSCLAMSCLALPAAWSLVRALRNATALAISRLPYEALPCHVVRSLIILDVPALPVRVSRSLIVRRRLACLVVLCQSPRRPSPRRLPCQRTSATLYACGRFSFPFSLLFPFNLPSARKSGFNSESCSYRRRRFSSSASAVRSSSSYCVGFLSTVTIGW